MVRITEELIRKKSEHNECIISTLEELSLHQEDVEKIEHLNNWCKDLQILYLQANLISKIENLNKLKKLQYLNLALNNIEVIENLSGCESLEKLDLTLNFIGNIESVPSLTKNFNLRMLILTGNPCTDFQGYRDYVVSKLPQITNLDGVDITKSERIRANQIVVNLIPKLIEQQEKYFGEREKQKESYAKRNYEALDDDTFWKTPSENTPEIRVEIAKRSRRNKEKDKEEPKVKKGVKLYSVDGRPLNINQAKLEFSFNDEDPKLLVLDIAVYKHLDTNLIDVDLQPIIVKVTLKEKVFQYVLPEEILTDKSFVQRSQTTGHLVIRMPRANYREVEMSKSKIGEEESVCKRKSTTYVLKTGIEYLEVDPKCYKEVDYRNILQSKPFEDNPEVPPLEFY